MKKTNYIISGVFAMIVVLLTFSQCKDKEVNASSETTEATKPIPEYLPIAYVNQDSLLINFNYYNSLVNTLENKASKQSNSINNDYQKFQKEVQNFQQKLQNNAFLTQERAAQEEIRLQRMQQDLEKRSMQAEQELALEQRVLQQQLSDSLAAGIKEFNNPQKYQMILTKSGNMMVLYADEHYDITNEVVDFLNKRFKSEE